MKEFEFILDGPLSAEALGACIERHRAEVAPKMQRNFDYYLGNVRVEKGAVAQGRPNNQAYSNLARYITDTATGYFMGMPPTYSFSGEGVQAVLDLNDETSVNYEIAENMSIAGVGFDLTWIDERGNVRITPVDPRTAFLIRSDTVDKAPVAGVRYWKSGDRLTGEVYTPGVRRLFTMKDSLVFTGEEALAFRGIPLTEYRNNRFMEGDFACVLKNIDQYNLTVSNTTDDLQSIANAFLAIVGMMGTDEEDIARMNRDRVVLLEEKGQMEFVTKDLNATAVMSHLKRLKQDIMQVAGVPDLTDEYFSGNVSGVALEYKMWGLNRLFAKKRAEMEKGLFARMAHIIEVLNLRGAALPEASACATVRFYKNMPRDLSTIVDNADKLKGIVSSRTLFEQIVPVTGVAAAEEAVRVLAEDDGVVPF